MTEMGLPGSKTRPILADVAPSFAGFKDERERDNAIYRIVVAVEDQTERVRHLESVLSGNGHPETGLIFRVAKLDDIGKRGLKILTGTAVTVAAGFGVWLLKAFEVIGF